VGGPITPHSTQRSTGGASNLQRELEIAPHNGVCKQFHALLQPIQDQVAARIQVPLQSDSGVA
jgi:hypothetical protein